MISDLGVGIWDLVAETRPVGRVSLDFGFWIVDFVSVPWFFLCFGDLVAETRPVGRVSLDFGFRILDFVSVPWFFLCFSVVISFRVLRGPCFRWSSLSVFFRGFRGYAC
jgi:hypothetical protein